MGPKGVEPLPVRLKGGSATVTPRPRMEWAYAFQSRCGLHGCLLVHVDCLHLSSPASSPGWSRTNRRRHIRSSCFPYNTGPQSGRRESNPLTRAPKARGPPLPFIPRSSGSYGSRTHLSVLKGRNPLAARRTSHVAKIFRKWVGRRSNPRLLGFSQALHRLSYQPLVSGSFKPTKKGPVSLGHRAFKFLAYLGIGRASQAQGESQIIRAKRGITRPYAFLSRTRS